MSQGLEIIGGQARIGARHLYGPLDFTIAPGEVLTIMGPSGVGKSTLLAWIAGTLDKGVSVQGTVRLNGRDVRALRPERRRIGLLFQDALLFPHLSVGANLGFGAPAHLRGAARRAAIAEALARAGLAGFEARDPAALSGGERSRVALMRALLAEPAAILLDEPFSKLDAQLRVQMRQFAFGEIARRRLPCLLVTHDPEDAAAAGGRVLFLQAR